MIIKKNQLIVTEEEGQRLVKIARLTIEGYLSKRRMTFMSTKQDLVQRAGVFVTLFSKDEVGKLRLRGCIGNPLPTSSLMDSLMSVSIKAATEDPRFHPIASNEFEHIIVEVSILSIPIFLDRSRNFQEAILIGKHGLIIESAFGSGLLLPQVARENDWDTTEFLENVCLKAGLDAHSWLAPDVRLYLFETFTFREITPGGDIVLIGHSKE